MRMVAMAAALLVAGPVAAGETTSELSFERFAYEQGPDHPLYCMYGYFASKTGAHGVAKEIFDRCVSEAKNPAAMVYLSLFYEEGLGVEQDLEKAEAIMRRAAEQGYSVAQYHLGASLLQSAETEEDRLDARHWLRKAADQGDEDAARLLGQAEG
ncbi:MAG: tetratricopeptide repeat protein [Geminicoccaceae bacterium]